MGFRSTFVSEHVAIGWPNWFRDKWGDIVHCGLATLSSKIEAKCYTTWNDLVIDIQKVLLGSSMNSIAVLFFHEDRGVTRATISKDGLKIEIPTDWEPVEQLWDGHG